MYKQITSNMKVLKRIDVLVLLLVCLVSSCKKEATYINIDCQSQLQNISAESNSFQFVVGSDGNWTVESTVNWISVMQDPQCQELRFSVETNTTGNKRSGLIVLKSAKASRGIEVCQMADKPKVATADGSHHDAEEQRSGTYVKIYGSNVLIRGGAGTYYSVVGHTRKGQLYTYLGTEYGECYDGSENRWFKVQTKRGGVGYVYSGYAGGKHSHISGLVTY